MEDQLLDRARMTGRGLGWMYYLLAVLGLFCVLVDYQNARYMFRFADEVQIYNAMLAVKQGNVLLNHWLLAVDNFYTTELPIYMLLSWVLGDQLGLIEIAPLVVFVLIVVASFGLVWQSVPAGRGRVLGLYIVLFLMALPVNPGTRWVMRSAFHNVSILLALVTLNLIAGAFSEKGFNRLLLLPFSVAIFAACSSDPFFDIFCLGPLLIFILLRAVTAWKIRPDEAWVFVCGLISALAGMGFVTFLADHHGFMTGTYWSTYFIGSAGELGRNFRAMAVALQQLFNASLQSCGDGLPAQAFAVLRMPVLAGIISIVIAICWSLWRRRPVAVLSQFLLLASLCLAGADLVSDVFDINIADDVQYAARFIVPIYIFVTIAVAIECPKLLFDQPLRGWRRIVAGYLIAVCCLQLVAAAWFYASAAKSPSYIQRYRLTASLVPWLEQQHYSFGVGDYQTTAWIGAASHFRVYAIPVLPSQGTILPYHWLCDDSALAAGRKPQFAVMPDNGNDFGLSVANLSAAYGKPLRILDVASYIVIEFVAP